MEQLSFTEKDENHLVYVIHKHHATALHYDLRLEIGGKMPSWAVPKAPSLDNKFKRLARHVNDHSMEYRTFEGNLPEGGVGAGPVMIWDYGIYYPEIEISKGVRERVEGKKEGDQVMKEGLKKGELKFFFEGKKLHGSFALVETPHFGPKDSWLMIKHMDEFVQDGYDAKDYDFSAVSGLTLEEIRNGEKRL